MNFDFLKDTRELGYVYENCSNAEKLVRTMPVQSVFTARKSAESLAKLIYMAAHKQQMEQLSFADILADQTVRDFIRSRDIMNAFHFIRKTGNRAVHEDSECDVEDALDVLQDLHYITGETACMLGLIQDYPQFDDSIDVYPDARYDEDDRVNEKAMEMFLAYVDKFDAMKEREKYFSPSGAELSEYALSGHIAMHEHLCFERAPRKKEVTEFIAEYLMHLSRLSVERAPGRDPSNSAAVVFQCDLLLASGEAYSTDVMDDFCDAIIQKLPYSNGFTLDIICKGKVREIFMIPDEEGNIELNMLEKDSIWTGAGMLDKMEYYKRRERFTYKLSIFYPDSGEYVCEKIENGRNVDIESLMTSDFRREIDSEEWAIDELTLFVDFDFEKYPELIQKLHAIVREYAPESMISFCEEFWEDENPGILLGNICWYTKGFKDVQRFLDEINATLAPITDAVEAGTEGYWVNAAEFAIARCQWTGKKFELIGARY